eukprot:gene15754-biopygen690
MPTFGVEDACPVELRPRAGVDRGERGGGGAGLPDHHPTSGGGGQNLGQKHNLYISDFIRPCSPMKLHAVDQRCINMLDEVE